MGRNDLSTLKLKVISTLRTVLRNGSSGLVDLVNELAIAEADCLGDQDRWGDGRQLRLLGSG